MLPRLVYAINTIILGYVINFITLFLHVKDENNIGILLVLLSFITAYFSESAYVHGTKHPKITALFQITTILSTATAIVLWLF